MEWQVGLTSIATKRIEKLPKPDRRRILIAIAKLHDWPSGDVKPLKGKPNQWRLRVGGWRIVLMVDTSRKVILVKYIDVRGDVYKN